VGFEETGMMGGTRTTIWWVGVIMAVAAINPLLKSSVMVYLSMPWKTIPFTVKILSLVTIWQTVLMALFSGWKGPIAFLCAYYLFGYISRFQRPLWSLIISAVLLFVFVVAPYVSLGRHLAAKSKISTSWERAQVFRDLLSKPELFLPSADREIDVSPLFRHIAPLAAELTRRNGLLEGEWGGDTIVWGLEILAPRVINPDKRDMNIGNFFARTVGADIGFTDRFGEVTNISLTIPFEFVGNFGLLSGLLAFFGLGIFWSLVSAWVLSKARLHSHPFTPCVIMVGMGIEGAMGHWLMSLRGFLLPLALLFFINRVVLRGKV
jgi:hypothetical protein